MKQSQIDRELWTIAKAEAKARGWKSVRGVPYWKIGPLFFDLSQSARVKEGSFYSSLRFKWLELDRLLWRVLDMSDNENAPFSLHAIGAFVLTGQEIQTISNRSLDWISGDLEKQVKSAMERANTRATEVASQTDTIDSYKAFIEREHEDFVERHPRAIVNVWKEALLIALVKGNLAEAKEIAHSRISAHDSGGFSSRGKSFYEHALELCKI